MTFDKDKIYNILFHKNLSLSYDKYFKPLNFEEIKAIAEMYNIDTTDKNREELCKLLKEKIDGRNFKIPERKIKVKLPVQEENKSKTEEKQKETYENFFE